jgi:hypothetical protein
MVGVAFDVEDGQLGVFCLVPHAVHDQAAAHRTVRTGIAGLGAAGELELPHFSQRIIRRKTERRNTGSPQSSGRNLEKLSSCHLHVYPSLACSDCNIMQPSVYLPSLI